MAIAWETGQVLAWEVLSKHFSFQVEGRHDSEEYKELYEGHKEERECNYKVSSNVMEIAGVKAIWLHSVRI